MKCTIPFEQTYNYFEPGTRVRTTSSRSSLPRDEVFTVTEMYIPRCFGDEAICFVVGKRYGVSTEYLEEVDE